MGTIFGKAAAPNELGYFRRLKCYCRCNREDGYSTSMISMSANLPTSILAPPMSSS
jgi:hypothetical protein